MDISREFPGPNAAYVLELYERYQQDPQSVDSATRAAFARWSAPPALSEGQAVAPAAPPADAGKIAAAANLARSIRLYGHLDAQLDPLGSPPPSDPSLDPQWHGLSDDDLRALPATLVGGPPAQHASNAYEAIAELRKVYSGRMGFDWAHVRIHEEREWLSEVAESCRFGVVEQPIDERALLERLTQVEAFEHFLQRAFPGKTRFSIEGLDVMVPLLDEVIDEALTAGVSAVFIGMAHRGRLNVLAHTLNKPYAQILAEFRDPVGGQNLDIRDDLGWTGDVKYHKGGERAISNDGQPASLMIYMPPNPSHLEHVNPVLEGMARAAATQADQPGPARDSNNTALPILIHGDAAFSGQGVVAETLNFSRLPSYTTAGTIHIISNNQLGFTTDPSQERSTLYASDLAKGFNIPIVHVNADNPEACIEAARLAFAYRARFHKDFLIDLIGYRRYGHNEGDEPAFTQPLLYAKIDAHPSVRTLWAQAMLERGGIGEAEAAELLERRIDEMQAILNSLAPDIEMMEPQLQPPPRGTAGQVQTAVPAQRLREINEALGRLPADFHVNPKLERVIQRRRRALDDPEQPTIDWGTAEELAFATILQDGTPIRLTGQDSERGTFNQRLAVYHDVENGQTFTPLQALPQSRAMFLAVNSPLSESAAVGFEYGYNIQAPERLVIWEAQYGDFINSAQAMVDEFIASGRAKWEQTPSLVLLLPHGYEGQGPDHSSGRIERFLNLGAEINLRIAYPTTAAQYFHLLRRQAALLERDPLPLVVMTPKSLLRSRLAASSLRDLTEGRWQPVIDDAQARQRPEAVRRLMLCSGKIYADMVSSERRNENESIAIARIEQLYLFPKAEIRGVLEGYPHLEAVTWVQEEPENMGAWQHMRPLLEKLIEGRWPLQYVGRPRSSSPAEGSSAQHAVNQAAIVEQAYNIEADIARPDEVWLTRRA